MKHNSLWLEWKRYSSSTFLADILAGLTVAIVLVPQGMAYALLAGLPPVYGLYAGLVPMIIYPLFSSSQTLSVGPVALMSILLLGSLTPLAEPGSADYIQWVFLVAFLSGILQVIFGVLRWGVLSNFLSRPVMSGFVSAAGVIIAISQIKYLFTLDVPRSSSVVQMLYDDYQAISTCNYYSFAMGATAFGILYILKKWKSKFPRYLLVVVLGCLAMYVFSLDQWNIPTVGSVGRALPHFQADFLNIHHVIQALPIALVISVVCFVGSYSTAETLESRQGAISANKELIGLGMAKLAGSFFMSMPATGSFTRSAINVDAGARTSMASIFCALFVLLTLIFLSPAFVYLPEPVLGGIVLASVTGLIKWQDALELWRIDRSDFWVFVFTFLVTLGLGIVSGIVAGVAISLLFMIRRNAQPHFAELGRLPNTISYRNVRRYPQAQTDPDHLILRYDQDLFFGNAQHFLRTLLLRMEERKTNKLVLHLGGVHNIDSTGARSLKQLIELCEERNIDLVFTNLSGKTRDLFRQLGLAELIRPENIHIDVAHAVLKDEDDPVINRALSTKYGAMDMWQDNQD